MNTTYTTKITYILDGEVKQYIHKEKFKTSLFRQDQCMDQARINAIDKFNDDMIELDIETVGCITYY